MSLADTRGLAFGIHPVGNILLMAYDFITRANYETICCVRGRNVGQGLVKRGHFTLVKVVCHGMYRVQSLCGRVDWVLPCRVRVYKAHPSLAT